MGNKTGAIIIEGHVQGLSNTRSLGEAGIPVIVVDTNNCIARYSRYCQKFFKCPPYHSDKLADFLINLAIEIKLDGWLLLPSNDHAVLTISRNRSRLTEHFKVITPSLDIIENIYDKSKLLKIATETGVPVPETYFQYNGLPNIPEPRFPVITKGIFGLDFYKATGRKAFLANDTCQLKDQYQLINKLFEVGKTFTQELIPDNGENKTVSFTAFCIDGDIKTYWMGVKLREHPRRFGTATLAESIFIQECHDLSVPLLKKLRYTGVCEVEYLKEPRDNLYKLIEINARTWLWVELARKCGVDYAKLMYDYVNGETISYPKLYDIGEVWINPFSDLVYSLIAILKGSLSLKEYLTTINKAKVNALFSKNDRRPGILYLLNLFSYLKNR